MIPIFQNPFAYDIAVPANNGSSVIVPPKKFVQGSYYQESVDAGILVLWTGATPSSVDIVYVYPEQEGYYPGVPTTIQNVIAGTGLVGGGTAGDVTLAVASLGITNSLLANNAVTSAKIAASQVVKSLNGLFDDITLAVGSNLTLTPVGNTLTLSAPTIGFTDVAATLPLILSINEGTLEGSISITPTDDGGAVALQTGSPTYQTGVAALNSLYLKSAADVEPFFRAYDSSSALFSSLDKSGIFYSQEVVNNSVSSSLLNICSSVSYDGTDFTYSDSVFSVLGSENWIFHYGQTFIYNLMSIGSVSPLNPANYGFISGAQITDTPGNLIDLYRHSTNANALLRLRSHQTSPITDTSNVFEYVDYAFTPLVSIHGDGVITAKTIEAGILVADVISYNTKIVTAGSYDLSITEGTIFACDCSSGAVTFELPLIDPLVTKNGTTYTFTKTTVGANNVLVAPANGQTINGQASVVLTTPWVPLRIAAVIGEGPTPPTFWMAV